MKKLTLAFLLTALASAPARAQTSAPAPDADQPETLTNRRDPGQVRLTGWFIAPTFGTTSFGDTLAYVPGVRGGIYLNRRLAIGLTGNALATDDTSFSSSAVRKVGTYGGLLVQYVVHSNELVHVSVESTLGNGRWCERITDDNKQDGNDDWGCSGRTFLVFEPVANIELNVSRHLRVATGVGYRFAAAGAGEGPSSRGMSGLVARTALVFGVY